MDTATNRRYSMVSFHDVMKSCRWEVRCLAFFLAVAEADIFSAYKHDAHDGHDTMHATFRWRLAQSLLRHAKHIEEDRANLENQRILRSSTAVAGHKRVSLGGGNAKGNPKRRRCRADGCGKKCSLRCKCDTDTVFCQDH